MTDQDRIARNRYFMITAARLAGAAGAVFGIVLLGRANGLWPQLSALAVIVAALGIMALLPRSLARRWRTPPAP